MQYHAAVRIHELDIFSLMKVFQVVLLIKKKKSKVRTMWLYICSESLLEVYKDNC